MSKKIAIGMVGAGSIAQANHMPAFASMSERCEIVAVSDLNEATAKLAAEKFGVCEVFTSHTDMLQKCQLDAVIVATPNRFHVEPSVDALLAGKHVLCEKPLATNGADARRMCAAAKKSKKVLQVGLQARFTGPAQVLKEYVDSGEMGMIYYARAQALRRRGVPSWGVFIDKDEQGGGPLIDLGVHILDLTMWLMGSPKPVSASGQTWNALGTNPALWNQFGDYDRSKFTVEDFASGFVRFENGAVISLEASFMANIEGNPYQTQLLGERSGAILKPFAADDSLKLFTEHDRRLFDMTPVNIPKVDAPHFLAASAFLDSIETGEPSKIPGEDGMRLNAIFDALYKSAQTGKEEAVDTSY